MADIKDISTEDLHAELERRKEKHNAFPWHVDYERAGKKNPPTILDANSVSIARVYQSDCMDMNGRILSCSGDGVELARYLVDKDSILSELPENKKAAVILAFAKRLLAKAGL